jgi:hypothetical protein
MAASIDPSPTIPKGLQRVKYNLYMAFTHYCDLELRTALQCLPQKSELAIVRSAMVHSTAVLCEAYLYVQ